MCLRASDVGGKDKPFTLAGASEMVPSRMVRRTSIVAVLPLRRARATTTRSLSAEADTGSCKPRNSAIISCLVIIKVLQLIISTVYLSIDY